MKRLALVAAVSLSLANNGWLWATAAEEYHPTQNQGVVRDDASLSRAARPNVDFLSRLPQKHQRVILCLGGGGCKVVGEIGVLKSLEKNGIKIDGVVGTSMGALIGAMYCAGTPLSEIEELFTSGKIQKAGSVNLFLRGTFIHPISVMLSKLHLADRSAGLSSGKRYFALLKSKLPDEFSDLRIPFAAVATNLTDGQTEILASGKLPEAVMASNTIPAVFAPRKFDGKLYVDGGLKANLPVKVASDKQSDLVIAVTVDTAIGPEPDEKLKSIRSVIKRVSDIMLAASDKHQAQSADILIYPNCDEIPILCKDARLVRKGIHAGEAAADKLMPEIRAKLENTYALERTSVNPDTEGQTR